MHQPLLVLAPNTLNLGDYRASSEGKQPNSCVCMTKNNTNSDTIFFHFSFSDNHTQPEASNKWQRLLYKTQLGKNNTTGIKSYHKPSSNFYTGLLAILGFLQLIRLGLQCESTNSAETFCYAVGSLNAPTIAGLSSKHS